MIASIFFISLLIISIYIFTKKINRIIKSINLGRGSLKLKDSKEGWRNVFLLALGQQKMFRKPFVAILHLIIYIGFILINIELLEIILDGVFNSHRILLRLFRSNYSYFISFFEVIAIMVVFTCFGFILRRICGYVKRLTSADLDGFPRFDGLLILYAEILIMSLFLLMNTADIALQMHHHTGYPATGQFLISQYLVPILHNLDSNELIYLERTAWWLHIIGIVVFLNYIPWSKHLHIFLAFPNAYYARTYPSGQMTNMTFIQQEVNNLSQPEYVRSTNEDPYFGAKDIFDLHKKHLMDAYSCSECGRCAAVCPATMSGKKLSPRKIMMATRDRLETAQKNIQTNGRFLQDGNTLLNDYITEEEILACTTCNACVEACPIAIAPVEIILELRRSLILDTGFAPKEWSGMFNSIETNYAPWKFSHDDRNKWTTLV